MQESALLLGQGHVFEESSKLLHRFCGVDLSAKQTENLCHHYGQLIEEQLGGGQEVLTEKPEDLHYAMSDGSFILSRENGWTEAKVGRVFRAADNFAVSESRSLIKESGYVAHIGAHTQFIDKMSPYLDGLKHLVFIADGAQWIWRWVGDSYPDAIQILDFYHAFEKISQWASLVFKDGKKLAAWREEAKELLLDDKLDELVNRIEVIDLQGDASVRKKALLTYLGNNSHRMTYKTFLEDGYLIGSGAIESAQRTVVQQRLKRSGQRWTIKGGQQVLNIRTKNLSNQWEEVRQLVKMAA